MWMAAKPLFILEKICKGACHEYFNHRNETNGRQSALSRFSGGGRHSGKGGNAFDAAVAVSACLAVVYPHMTGLGGDSFWLTYHKETGRIKAYNGSGRSGKHVTRDLYRGREAIPLRGTESAITVPGMADSWDAVLSAYGRLSLAEVLKPALDYAANGFPVSADQCAHTERNLALLASTPYTSAIYTRNKKRPCPVNGLSKGSGGQLGATCRERQKRFYEGDLAQRITSFCKTTATV